MTTCGSFLNLPTQSPAIRKTFLLPSRLKPIRRCRPVLSQFPPPNTLSNTGRDSAVTLIEGEGAMHAPNVATHSACSATIEHVHPAASPYRPLYQQVTTFSTGNSSHATHSDQPSSRVHWTQTRTGLFLRSHRWGPYLATSVFRDRSRPKRTHPTGEEHRVPHLVPSSSFSPHVLPCV
jgi:hypothetical protein